VTQTRPPIDVATVDAPTGDAPTGEGRTPWNRQDEPGHCRHCGLPVPTGSAGGPRFCCSGCAAAYDLINGLGLDGYYRRRVLSPDVAAPKPDDAPPPVDYHAYTRDDGAGIHSLSLLIEGLHCAACVWLVEAVLARTPGVVAARVNMTTRRLAVSWRADETDATTVAAAVGALGYRVVPFDPALADSAGRERERELLRAMAVAGFAAGNVMLLSVAIWAGHVEGMGPATRTLLHWVSALIALPAIAWAGRPFFRSAATAIRARRLNMDVPISLAVLLAAGISLHETMRGGQHAYFDSAVALLFFLLIGRFLDQRARGRARSAAAHLLALAGTAVTVIAPDGQRRVLPPTAVRPGMRVAVAAGDRIAVDGCVREGASDVDTSLIDGETVPTPVTEGARVFAGTLNLGGPLVLEVTAVGDDTLLAEIARLMEAAEGARGRHVAIADRISRMYAPVVHSLAAITFVGWWVIGGVAWQAALLNAIAVLIITCPCALALAVPTVQVVASGRLLRRGILLKSATALERFAEIDMVVFDKTGTLTEGRPELLDAYGVDADGVDGVAADGVDAAALSAATALASVSRHPLARALVRDAERRGIALGAESAASVREVPGAGLERAAPAGIERLGSRDFCAVVDGGEDDQAVGPELWFARPGRPAVRFRFADRPRDDAAAVVRRLAAWGIPAAILSGDRESAVAAAAAATGIDTWQARSDPAAKVRRLEALAAAGHRVLMVGDGLNDAPALAAAHASMSPSTAVDLSQTAADVVFQGARLAPVVETLGIARRAGRLVRQNFALTFLYNALTIPLAVAGFVTPLIAAIAMSASSVVVIANALRLNRGDAA
jgi:P-type Cu2+ transporter